MPHFNGHVITYPSLPVRWAPGVLQHSNVQHASTLSPLFVKYKTNQSTVIKRHVFSFVLYDIGDCIVYDHDEEAHRPLFSFLLQNLSLIMWLFLAEYSKYNTCLLCILMSWHNKEMLWFVSFHPCCVEFISEKMEYISIFYHFSTLKLTDSQSFPWAPFNNIISL